jgi:pantoate--beta-alanine ligase
MNVVHTIADCRAARAALPGNVALVPTMGALHEGHLALVRHARTLATSVAVSIFVNPTQFGPREDFNRYPRPIDDDLRQCAAAGADFVFDPSPGEMYPGDDPRAAGARLLLDVPPLTEPLEGRHRPGHFRGVCQVVAKLFNIVCPDIAIFGLKDFQQFLVLREMVRLLNLPVEVVGHPTIREPDGLAMSSRNAYLSPDERRRALSISRALSAATEEYREHGVLQCSRLVATMTRILLDPGDLGRVPVSVDYAVAVDATTLQPADRVDRPTLLAIAARVGATRLIDNAVIGPVAGAPA